MLNVRSTFTPEVFTSIPQMYYDYILVIPSTCLELLLARLRYENGKAAGEPETLPELVVYPDVFIDCLAELLAAIWDSEVVLMEWVHAQLVPIPKKGNLAERNNW